MSDSTGDVAEKLRAQLSRDEGRIPHCYFDHLGYATIGVGHLIDERRGGSIPEFVIDILLDDDIRIAKAGLHARLHWFSQLDPIRQAVLINMAFNLGIGGLLQFRKTLAFIEAREYAAASREMLDSDWAKQVGPRANRLAIQMETGQWR